VIPKQVLFDNHFVDLNTMILGGITGLVFLFFAFMPLQQVRIFGVVGTPTAPLMQAKWVR
jgi:hypothetical protein